MKSFSVSGYGPERPRWTRLFARDSVVRRLEWPILLSALALSFIGPLLVYSATRNRTTTNQGDPHYFLVRHLMNFGIGFVLMAGTLWLGHRALRNAVPALYGLSVLGVPAVPTPLGANSTATATGRAGRRILAPALGVREGLDRPGHGDAALGTGRRGIVAWFSLQSFENIGVALGIMPMAGIPLPFVSYGGSSMFAVWVVVGLLQSIRVQRPVQA